MAMYKTLNKQFDGDVGELRKILIKKIIDEGKVTLSYDLLSFFHSDSNHIAREFELQFLEVIYRVKSALPTSTTEEIFGDFMEEVVARESAWADGWAKYYEKAEARKKYKDASNAFTAYRRKVGNYHHEL